MLTYLVLTTLVWMGLCISPVLVMKSKWFGLRFFPKYPTLGQIGFCCLAVILFLLYLFVRPQLLPPLEHRTILIDKQAFSVEVAKTEARKERGLMGRSKLQDDKGMLFVWEKPQHQQFWMKGTLIPLDILFFDTNGLLVGMSSETPICIMEPCPTYDGDAKVDSQFVVELASGVAAAHGFKVGQSHLTIEPKAQPKAPENAPVQPASSRGND